MGSGEAAWDESAPEDDRAVTGLVHEVARKAVDLKAAVFLDDEGQ